MNSTLLLTNAVLSEVRRALALSSANVVAPGNAWAAWSFDPITLAILIASGYVYLRGVGALWKRAGVGVGISIWRVVAFCGGLLTIYLALISPLDALSETLFSAHMAQHLMLLEAAAPLLILGKPETALLWALPLGVRHRLGKGWKRARAVRSMWHIIGNPAAAAIIYVCVLWTWHAPALYQAALTSPALHLFEHACFLAIALLLWWTIVPHGRHPSMRYGIGILAVFVTGTFTGLLGALMNFSRTPWYPAYVPGEAAWGLTPLSDQQLAGLVMWIPTSAVHMATALVLFALWIRAAEHRAEARDRARQQPVHPVQAVVAAERHEDEPISSAT